MKVAIILDIDDRKVPCTEHGNDTLACFEDWFRRNLDDSYAPPNGSLGIRVEYVGKVEFLEYQNIGIKSDVLPS